LVGVHNGTNQSEKDQRFGKSHVPPNRRQGEDYIQLERSAPVAAAGGEEGSVVGAGRRGRWRGGLSRPCRKNGLYIYMFDRGKVVNSGY
jgi:hypothetical protein